jgi:hypothetical protein
MTATLHTAYTFRPSTGRSAHQVSMPAGTQVLQGGAFRTIAVLALAPVLGLVFIIAAPLAGLTALVWTALQALIHSPKALRTLRNVALFFAAPFIGLVYVVLMPVGGLVLLAVAVTKR